MWQTHKSNSDRYMEQIITNINSAKWYEYAILLFLMLWSGGGFTYGVFPEWMLFMLPLVGFIFFQKGYKLSKSACLFIGMVLMVHLLQMISYGGAIINIIKPACVLFICAMFAKILSSKFVNIYVDLVYYISLICLILWIICLFPFGLSLLKSVASSFPLLGWDNIENNTNVVTTLYIFSIPLEYDGVIRNSGPFWEPGRFTIYITLALAIVLFYFKESITSKRSLVLILTNITTFSTTGYVAMSVIFLGYIFFSNIKRSYKLILFVILFAVVYYVGQLDFMTEKIAEQYADDSTWSRFGAIAYHWSQIIQSPLIGFGPFLSNVFANELFSSPNGLTDLMRYYGIPLSILFYFLLYRGTAQYVSNSHWGMKIIVFSSLVLLCFSQTITYSPFFMVLYFFAFNTCSYD
jgi:hypothetical protein